MPGTQQVLKQYLRNDRKGKVTPAPRESVTLSELCVCVGGGGESFLFLLTFTFQVSKALKT